MMRTLQVGFGLLLSAMVASASAAEIEGFYLEARTCQIFTGPCFANAEFGLTGKDAIMAWSVEKGAHQGVDLAGLNAVMVICSSETLANGGIDDAKQIKSVIVVDERASLAQREALIDFVKQQSGRAGNAVVRTDAAPIRMSLDLANLNGELAAGKSIRLSTRKARPGDCICTNEVAYYPPLAKLQNFVPAVSIEAAYSGRGLGTTWSMPNTRTAYMGLFSF